MKTISKILVALSICPLFANSPAEPTPTWKDKVRVRTLQNIDELLYWGVSKKRNPFPLEEGSQQEVFHTSIPELDAFANKYGYFSLNRPLVGKVSSSQEDVKTVCMLLQTLPLKNLTQAQFQITSSELLSKVLAYRDLKAGQKIQIPIEGKENIHLETFTVDHVFDIWQGMPAFGLVPETEHVSSILLFRGTDFSLISKRGIASVLSDLDPSGPGLKAFFHDRKEIGDWLQAVQQRGKPARVIGFSLGGALAAYTFIYENGYLSNEPSISVCAPGVAPTVIKAWDRLPSNRKPLFVSYIDAGDLVSQVGSLFGTVYCLSTNTILKPLTAHTTLMSTHLPLYKIPVNTTRAPFKNTIEKP